MFENAKVGDRVWSIQRGWGTIEAVGYTDTFPIFVTFDSNDRVSYTNKGKVGLFDALPTLFWNEFQIPEAALTKPLPKLEVDTKVIVWIEPNLKVNRYFSHFGDKGQIHCFSNGGTSWSANTTSSWPNWELADE